MDVCDQQSDLKSRVIWPGVCDRASMEAMMATPDLPEVPPGTETYAVDDDVDATQLQMTSDGMITEPVLGIRMLMSSRVS